MGILEEHIRKNRVRLEKIKKREVVCDVCRNRIDSERFKVVMVFDADRVDKFFDESLSKMEKELVVCNDCILNLNFRPTNMDAQNSEAQDEQNS